MRRLNRGLRNWVKQQYGVGLAALAIVLCLSACQTDTGMENVSEREQIRLAYATPEITRGTNTGIQDVEFDDDLLLGLYIDAPTEVESYANVSVQTLSNGGLLPERLLFYPLRPADKVSVYAYAPYQPDWTEGTSAEKPFEVAKDQSTDEAVVASDLLWGTPAANPFRTTEAVQLFFKHRLTKVVLTLDMQKSLFPVSGDIVVKMLDVRRDCNIHLATGTIAEGDRQVIDTLTVAHIDGSTLDDYLHTQDDTVIQRCCAIVVPQTVKAGHPLFLIEWPDGRKNVRSTREDVLYPAGSVISYSIRLEEADLIQAI